MNSSLLLPYLGQKSEAEALAKKTANEVPAYRHWLRKHNINILSEWNELPPVDKKTYLLENQFSDLVGSDFDNTFTIIGSSGSSGRPFYWPQLKTGMGDLLPLFQKYLETLFQIGSHRTVAIVGLALGSWIGGDMFSWLLKSLALRLPYPFAVFSPGNKHGEIIDFIHSSSRFTDRIILFCCPSAIGHLVLRAKESGKPLPLEKMRFVVIGEPFDETLRKGLHQQGGIPDEETLIASIYGSADTGTLGFESPASIALRKLIRLSPSLAAEFGISSGVIPHYFHHVPFTGLMESLEGELCITRWQGIPLVRYNLHDQVRFFSWNAISQRLQTYVPESPECVILQQKILEAPPGLSDLLSISGRADACLILCGTNISEIMLDTAIRDVCLTNYLTGFYQAGIVVEEGRQRLSLDLELRNDIDFSDQEKSDCYDLLIKSIGRAQPEFLDDWQNVYRIWDHDPESRILKINWVTWPGLSSMAEKSPKFRGIKKVP